MRYLFELSGEHPDLPEWEAGALLSCSGSAELIERDALAAVFMGKATPDEFAHRISLSHFLSEHLMSVNLEDLESAVEEIDLSGYYTAALKARVAENRRPEMDTRDLIGRLGRIVSRKTKIDLENPDINLRIYIGESAHIGREIVSIDRSQYEKRKNRFLPFTSPISIHPRLARALINLTAKSPSSRLLDPFCGTGAILIEAAMMGMKTHGSDISKKMIDGSDSNLRHLNLNAELKRLDVGDIGEFSGKFDCVVTDPPYGRAATTKREPIERLYSRAMDAFAEILVPKGRVGIIVPDENILKYESQFELLKKASIRVHRSLVRNFAVLELK